MASLDRVRRLDQAVLVLREVLVDTSVPDDHRAAAVFGVGVDAFVPGVLDGVVGGRYRETLGRRVHRRPARDRPGLEHTVDLEPYVVVQPARIMKLYYEDRGLGHL